MAARAIRIPGGRDCRSTWSSLPWRPLHCFVADGGGTEPVVMSACQCVPWCGGGNYGIEAFGSRLGDQVDRAAVAPFLGRYDNPVLGEVSLELQDGTLFLDGGEIRSELRPELDEQGSVVGYVIADSPMAPLPVMRRQGEDGVPSLVVPNPAGGNEYVFTAVSEAKPRASSL